MNLTVEYSGRRQNINSNYGYLVLTLLIIPIIYLIRYFKLRKQNQYKVKILSAINRNSAAMNDTIEIDKVHDTIKL